MYSQVLLSDDSAFGFSFDPGFVRCFLFQWSFGRVVCDVQAFIVRVEDSSGVYPPRFNNLECAKHAIVRHPEQLDLRPSSSACNTAHLLTSSLPK